MAKNLNVVMLNGASPYLIRKGGGSSSGGGSKGWTGHADVQGLKAIGWTDEDIEYYQEHGVNWNEEDDAYHKVPEDNIALYGVLTAKNISTYKNRIVYLPKIDTSSVTDMSNMFSSCYSLVSIPQLYTSNVTTMSQMFYNCNALTSIPMLDTSNVTNTYSMFSGCYSLKSVMQLDFSNVTSMSNMFYNCYSLQTLKIKNVKMNTQVHYTNILNKESLLYIINNEAATSSITISCAKYIYDKFVNDADVVAALANHPNISIAK